MNSRDLRAQLDELYADYVACLDDGNLEGWPDLFVEQGSYRMVSRENHDRGLPLATLSCESRGMMKDRVVAIRQTSMYAPRYMRHIVSSLRFGAWRGDALDAQANYVVFETLVDEMTRVFQAGRFIDSIVVDDGRLKFRDKLCVFDSVLVANSIVFPV